VESFHRTPSIFLFAFGLKNDLSSLNGISEGLLATLTLYLLMNCSLSEMYFLVPHPENNQEMRRMGMPIFRSRVINRRRIISANLTKEHLMHRYKKR
jgi:hypothetical protein